MTGRSRKTAAGALRWFQFRLRTLLVLTAVCALFFGWVGVRVRRARVQREAVAAIRGVVGHGYAVTYDIADPKPVRGAIVTAEDANGDLIGVTSTDSR